jgi:hypothetical protein
VEIKLPIKAAYVVADGLLTELQSSSDLCVVGTLRQYAEYVRLPFRQMGGGIFPQDPSGRFATENLITQMDGDNRGPGCFRGCVLEQNTRGTGDHGGTDAPVGIGRQHQCPGGCAFGSKQPYDIDAIGPRQLQIYQDDVNGSRDAESEEVLITVRDTDDIQAFVLAEETS